MGSGVEIEAANVAAPHIGQIAVIAVTTSSGRTNLAASGQLNGEESKSFITLVADGGKVWFFMNNADAGTADETAVSGNDRVMMIPDGGRMDFRLRDGFTWIVHKGSATCKLRVYRSGRGAAQ